MTPNKPYTCREYRQEMQLIALRRQLEAPGLPAAQRETLKKEIRRLETEMDLA